MMHRGTQNTPPVWNTASWGPFPGGISRHDMGNYLALLREQGKTQKGIAEILSEKKVTTGS